MNSRTEAGRWIICPVCHRPNPCGTNFCEYCWGAALHSGATFTLSEAQIISKRRLSRQKCLRVFKVVAISLTSLFVLVFGVFFWFYSMTDLVSKPPQNVNSNSLPGEWAMFRHDTGRSGATGSSGLLPQGKVAWVFPTGGAIHSSPAVADGIVHIGSSDNKLYAVDAATGAKRWEYSTGSWIESSPVIAGGVVYFGSNDGRLYALDADTGEKLWDFKTNYPIMSSPAVADAVVYFGADDYYVYALDAAKGTKLWDFKTRGIVKSSPVVANGIVYIGSGGDLSYALDARDGRLRLQFRTSFPVYSSPAVNGEAVYFVHTDGYLYAVDGYARSWPWEHDIRPHWIQLWLMGIPGVSQPPPQSGFLWGLRIGTTNSSSPAVAADILYVGADNKLLAIDLQGQRKLWEFETEDRVRSSPALADATIYIGSEDGRLYALDAASGDKLWDILIGGKITSSPTLSDGVVFVGSQDGNLYAIR